MSAEGERPRTPEAALRCLVEGNRRSSAGLPRHPHQRLADRAAVVKAQHPYAVIVGCADSRVPPELVFDQGIGDLFVVRTAGHVIDDAITGSIEYAVVEFAVPLVLVLGHERCGAVQATLDAVRHRTRAGGHVDSILRAIMPAVSEVLAGAGARSAKRAAGATATVPTVPAAHAVDHPVAAVAAQAGDGGTTDDVLARAIEAHVARVVHELRADEPLIAPAVRAGTLRVVGAHFGLADGLVRVIVP